MTPAEATLTHARLLQILHYDPETGVFTWLIKPAARTNIGDVAGGVHTRGYRIIRYERVFYRAGRLAVFYMTGEWPQGMVDHINRNRQDDRYSNLRVVTQAENQWNTVAKCNNRLGLKGITFRESSQHWIAEIRVGGRSKHLGCFATQAEAIAARNTAAMLIHGEFFVPTMSSE